MVPARPAAPRPVALVGTTASGKSALALDLARSDPTIEIVSVDSMQVYRGMDIGTAKPTPADRAEVPHHLIDIADPWDEFTVAWFAAEARRAVDDIAARGRRALLVGGTGLYLQAVVDELQVPGRYAEVRATLDAEPDTAALHARLAELDPVAAGRMEATNRRRVVRALEVTLGSGRPFSSYGPGLGAYPPSRYHLVGVRLPHDVVAERIEARYRRQMADGFLAEVERLLADPRGLSRTARQALGYRELASHLEDAVPLDDALDLAVRRTRRFARRQASWFRRDPRILWLDAADDPATLRDALGAEVAAADGAGRAGGGGETAPHTGRRQAD
ncbi:MAG TPA: tRNA (adenosine(37)-N6)-dimethylallyltransferase MiaA [Acidimicrobiales bacterium]|nr:tRNA (adenosine(37)-N6)-dimethylallyltransferase MiaA [Acidimicrobiales bacterium]